MAMWKTCIINFCMFWKKNSNFCHKINKISFFLHDFTPIVRLGKQVLKVLCLALLCFVQYCWKNNVSLD